MAKIGFLAILMLLTVKTHSQEYFVLIQAENNQPFYAKLGDHSFNSTSTGHLILSRLTDSAYTLTIGFLKSPFPERQYRVVVNGRDLQLQLKNQGEKGWGLFDRQSSQTRMPEKEDGFENNKAQEGARKEDAFSRLMAGVVNDTLVMYNTYSALAPVVAIPVPLPVDSSGRTPAMPADMDSSARTSKITAKDPKPEKDKKPAVEIDKRWVPEPKPLIEKLSESRSAGSLKLVFLDHGKGGAIDTISIQIPQDTLPPPSAGALLYDTTPPHVVSETSSLPSEGHISNRISAGKGQASSPILDTASIPTTAVATAPAGLLPVATDTGHGVHPSVFGTNMVQDGGKQTPVLVNSDCRNFASDNDVDKLRIKMMSGSSDKERVGAALKIFKTKCFFARQIKALSEVFTSEEGRMDFFEAAYPFVSDSDQFKALAGLLSDPALIGRFKKMTGQ